MGVEVRPFGVRCNIACTYCYQQPEREAGNVLQEYDLARLVDALDANGSPFTLFGGEPLLMPLRDLERLWQFGLARFGRNSVQTNGTLVNDHHIELFHRYQVNVGVSCDGPGRCNELRVAGDQARTDRATARTLAVLDRLIDEGLQPGLIVTLHRANAVGARLDELIAWLVELDRRGLRSARLHLLEVDDAELAGDSALSAEENIAALTALLMAGRSFENLQLDVENEVRRLLGGRDRGVGCVWMACDPYTTRAVQGLEGSGQLSNCGRTNKLGIDFVKADHAGYERYLALYHTPQEDGGCRGCRFFLQCKGQCPGTAIDGDWRNRTEHCDVWKHLFAVEETAALSRGELPVSQYPQRQLVEQAVVQTWGQGRTVDVQSVLAWLRDMGVDPAIEAPETLPAAVASLPALDVEAPVLEAGDGMRLIGDWHPHDWSRLSWASDAARVVWEPRFREVREMWGELEWRSVAAGIRPCAVVLVPGTGLEALETATAEVGLDARPIETFTARAPEQTLHRWQVGNAVTLVQVAVGSTDDLDRLVSALEERDNATVAELIGTPACCTSFHHDQWVNRKVSDITWPSAARGSEPSDRTIDVHAGPSGNLLWRSLGLRPVFHLPCSDTCEETRRQAERVKELAGDLGFAVEQAWLEEILSWPVSWSALHGIAEILTPIGKISTNTDPTLDEHLIRRHGSVLPVEMVAGLRFPYDLPTHDRGEISGHRTSEPVPVSIGRRS